tara:strand:+ start:86 stop:274 length:189 start_codon:yes stop_codon:yes gene_type:complete
MANPTKKLYMVSWSETKDFYIEVEATDEEEAKLFAFHSNPHHYEEETHDIEVDEVQGSEVSK